MRKYNEKNYYYKDYTIKLWTVDNRNGFKHEGYLKGDGVYEWGKCIYYNRTWECFKYESLITSLFKQDREMKERDKKAFMRIISGKEKMIFNLEY